MKRILIATALLLCSSLSLANPCNYADPSESEQHKNWLKMNTVKRLFSSAGEPDNTTNIPNDIACKIALESEQLLAAFDHVIHDAENKSYFVKHPIQFVNRAIIQPSSINFLQSTIELLDEMIDTNQGSKLLLAEAREIRNILSQWPSSTFRKIDTRYIFQEEYVFPMMINVLDRESVVTNRRYLRFTVKRRFGKNQIKTRFNCGELRCGESIYTAYTPTHDHFTADKVCNGGLYGINNYGSIEDGIIYRLDTLEGNAAALTGINATASNIASHQGSLYFIEQLSEEDQGSVIHSYDLSTSTHTTQSETTSYPIYRSVFDENNNVLKATSLTYLYDFDIATGKKTVLGKLSYPGDNFKHGDIAFADNGYTFYVLTGKALYSVDLNDLTLTEIGQHGIEEASGLAISPEGTIYVSGFENGETPTIYSVDPFTAQPSVVFSLAHHINDLTYVNNFCNK